MSTKSPSRRVPPPKQLSANPVVRVLDDVWAETRVRRRSAYPPGPQRFSFARTRQAARDPLPLLLGALRGARADLQRPPPAQPGDFHARAGGEPLRHRRPPGELPLARVELRRPDSAARRRPADDRRRLPRPCPGDHDAGLPSRAGGGLGGGDGDRGDAGDRAPARGRGRRRLRLDAQAGDADRDAGAARPRPRRGGQGRRSGRALRAGARLLRHRLPACACCAAPARPGEDDPLAGRPRRDRLR